MKYNGIIDQKLKHIEEKVSAIRSWEIDSFEKLQNSSLLQNATERALQVAIEVMIDVSERILAMQNIAPQQSAADSIRKLQEIDVLSPNTEYIEMIKFGNFIVHRYEKIDIEIIYSIIRKKLNLFEDFIEEIRTA